MNNDSTGRRPQTITNAVGTDANDGTFSSHVGKVLVITLHRRRQVRCRASLVIKHQSRLVSNAACDLGARVHKVVTERLWHDWVVVVQRVLHDEVANPSCRCLQLPYRPVTRLSSYLAELTAVSRTVARPAGQCISLLRASNDAVLFVSSLELLVYTENMTKRQIGQKPQCRTFVERFCFLSLTTQYWCSRSKISAITMIVIVQGLTSPPTQYRLYGRRFLQVKRPNQQYQSIEGTQRLHN